MRNTLHLLFLWLLLSGSLPCAAQATGIKLINDYYHPLLDDDRKDLTPALGLGVDRDMNDHLGFGVELRMVPGGGASSWELLYHTKYFVSDNEATAFYFGTFIGWQRVLAEVREETPVSGSYIPQVEYHTYGRTQVPIGMRIGVRGGLSGLVVEGFMHGGYNLGNGTLSGDVRSAPLFLSVGLAVGGGW